MKNNKAELLKISGVAIDEGDDPHTVNLFYLPPHEGGQSAVWKGPTAYHFRIAIPIKYPFVPPTWKWVSRPLQKPHRCLGPDGVVSVEALSQWTPANSLSNVLISLFPSCTLADQCSSVTSHLWNLKHNQHRPALTVTNPEVLDCLAAHLVKHDAQTAHALHCTCRAAAAAVQDAMTSLSVTGRHADLAHTALAFPGLSDLKYTQCAVLVEPLLEVDSSMHLFNSLRKLSIVRCDVPLFGSRGLFSALRGLQALCGFTFEPSTAMLWAVCDNEGCTSFAKCPIGEDSKLAIPDDVPTPVPYEWSSMWVGMASVTHLTSLSVTIPLCDKLLPTQRDASRHAWPAAAAIADYAFSQKCLSAMPCLKELALEIQHIMQSSRSPMHAEEAGNGAEQNQSSQVSAWNLPSGQLTSFSLSGVALGTEQLNYSPEIQVRPYESTIELSNFWAGLESLHIGHTSVTEELQSSALKRIVSLARNVEKLDIASLEELLSKLSLESAGTISYTSLRNLKSLHTSLTSQLDDVLHLTHIKLYHTATYLNLNVLAANLPDLKCLEGLPFRTPTDPKNYWPLRQCCHLESLHMQQGPAGSAEEIREILGHRVKVEVPALSGQNPRSQAVFRRGFLPAHRPILSSLIPTSGQSGAHMASMMSDTDFECVAAQGYALGFENSSATDSGPLEMMPTVDAHSAGVASQSRHTKPGVSTYPESPAQQNLSPNVRPVHTSHPSAVFVARAFTSSTAEVPTSPGHSPRSAAGLWPHEEPAEAAEGQLRPDGRAAGMPFFGVHDWPARKAVESRRARMRRSGFSSCLHPSDIEDRRTFSAAGPSRGSERYPAGQAPPRTEQEARQQYPTAIDRQSSMDHMYASSSVARSAAISAAHDEEMQDLALMDSFADIFQEDTQEENADSDPSPSFGALTSDVPSLTFSPSTSLGPSQAPCAARGVLQPAIPRGDNPFSSGSFGAAGASSSGLTRSGQKGVGNKVPRSSLMSAPDGIADQRRKSTQMLLPSSFHPEQQAPYVARCAAAHAPPRRQTPSPSPPATVIEEAGDAAVPPSRERSHSPVSRRFRVGPSARYGNGSPYRATGSRANAGPGTSDRFRRGASPASRTSSSLFSDERASPMPHGSSSEEPSQSPSNPSAVMAARMRSHRMFCDGASSNDVRAERVRLEGLELQAHRNQSLELHRNMHRAIARTVRARRGARETLMHASKPTRLQLFGSEATPQGVASTPQTLRMLSSLPPSPTRLEGLPSPTLDAPMTCEEHPGVCKDDKVIKILEMPLCPCGHRPLLIAQVNAQASPQFEKLGPYLVRIGCCKACKIQVPSVVDLTKEDVTGTSTDSLLVVSNELHKNVVQRQNGTIRAHRAKSGSGVMDVDTGNGDEGSSTLMPAGTTCMIEQVRRVQWDVSQPCTSAIAEMGGTVLQSVAWQSCKALWISCWVPTEPALEAPARNDVFALARMYNVPTPPTTQQSQSNASSKLGGNTRSAASPSCRLCCNRMGLVLSLPSDGMVVTQPRSCAMIVEVFKCPLHPHEMQCSWSCHEEQATRPQEENAANAGNAE